MPNADTTQESIATELTRFQLEILYLLSDCEDQSNYGLGIKRRLEAYYDTEVNHGRLYPNLDDLVELGLIEKSELDKRTNEYELTAAGCEVIRRDAQRRYDIVETLKPSAPTTDEMPEPAATGGDD